MKRTLAMPSSGIAAGAESHGGASQSWLFLFSGPVGRGDSFAYFAAAAGLKYSVTVLVLCVDVLNGTEFDMADQLKFETLLARVAALEFKVVLMSPPCATFSRIRGRPGGPRKLRSGSGPGRYGLQHLKPHEKEQTRLGTLLAVRAAQVADVCCDHGVPWLNEQPKEHEGEASMYGLDEWLAVRARPGVVRSRLVQCAYGSAYVKATDLFGNFALNGIETCPHGYKHESLGGVVDGVFRTKGSAAYPAKLNEFLADAFSRIVFSAPVVEGPRPACPRTPVCKEMKEPDANTEQKMEISTGEPLNLTKRGRWSNQLVRSAEPMALASQQSLAPVPAVHFAVPLRGRRAQDGKKAADALSVGGLRGTACSVDRLTDARAASAKVRHVLEELLDNQPEIQAACLAAVGSERLAGPSLEQLELARAKVATVVNAASPHPFVPDGPRCAVAGDLLLAWAQACRDPDADTALWATHGAPAGILVHPARTGIFPDAVEDQGCVDPLETEFGDPALRHSYDSVECDDHALDELHRLVDKGFVKKVSTLEECKAALNGETPVVSKFGMVEKKVQGKVVKRRLILDAKESGVTQCGRKNERIMLPSVVDAIFDALDLHAHHNSHEVLEWMVLDVSDAFWTLGLRPEERKYFVGKLRGEYYMYERLAQGSRGAPLAWCRFFALIMRLTMAMFVKPEARAQAYVDDPIFTFTGTASQRDRAKALVILAWRMLNIDLSFRKGQLGHSAAWIGCKLVMTKAGVLAALQAEAVKEMREMIAQMLKENVASVKVLRSLAGKLSNAARLLTTWRPFLAEIWAALCSPSGRAPPQTVWVRQIAPALRWFAAFLDQQSLSIMRPFLWKAYVLPAERTVFTVDASPWGLGAVLVEDGAVVEYLADQVTDDDCKLLGVAVGSPDSQQVLEALAMLVALRTWRARWQQWRSTVAIRGDNVTMLTMVLNFKGSSPALSLLARELALEVANAAYKPLLAEHIPGVANVTADGLSRLHAPGGKYQLPQELAKVKRASVERRSRDWYRAIGPPAADGRVSDLLGPLAWTKSSRL